MNGKYLINLIENYCKQSGKDITDTYRRLGVYYQDTYGINIAREAEEKGQYDIVSYLQDRGIIDRYVALFNRYIMQSGKCSTSKISDCYRTEQKSLLSDVLGGKIPEKLFLSEELKGLKNK